MIHSMLAFMYFDVSTHSVNPFVTTQLTMHHSGSNDVDDWHDVPTSD